jgi:hypothetical protein
MRVPGAMAPSRFGDTITNYLQARAPKGRRIFSERSAVRQCCHMSALGQKRKFSPARNRSALCQKRTCSYQSVKSIPWFGHAAAGQAASPSRQSTIERFAHTYTSSFVPTGLGRLM